MKITNDDISCQLMRHRFSGYDRCRVWNIMVDFLDRKVVRMNEARRMKWSGRSELGQFGNEEEWSKAGHWTGLNQVNGQCICGQPEHLEGNRQFFWVKIVKMRIRSSKRCEHSQSVARPKASGSTCTCRAALTKDDKNHDDNLDDRENEWAEGRDDEMKWKIWTRVEQWG